MKKICEDTLFDVGRESYRNELENAEFNRVTEKTRCKHPIDKDDYYIELFSDQLPYVIHRLQEHLDENKSNTLGIVVTSAEERTFKVDVIELKQE